MRLVGAVACGKPKQPNPAPARELYNSTQFKICARFVQAYTDEWFILSALHGVLEPETVIAPYERSLASMTPEGRRNWRRKVAEQIASRYDGDTVFLTPAGKLYRAALPSQRTICPWDTMADMKFGKQKRWMLEQIRSGSWEPALRSRRI